MSAASTKKAAANALELLNRWPEPSPPENWVAAMTAVARDEVEHLAVVSRLLARRGGRLTRQHSNPYASRLRDLVRAEADVVRGVQPGRKRQHPVDALARKRGDRERRRLEVRHAREELALYLPDPLGGDEVALVHEDAARGAGVFDLARYPEVAGDEPVDGVHQ